MPRCFWRRKALALTPEVSPRAAPGMPAGMRCFAWVTGGRSLGRLRTTTGYRLESLRRDPFGAKELIFLGLFQVLYANTENSGIPSGCAAISRHSSGGRSGKAGTATGYLLPTLWVEKLQESQDCQENRMATGGVAGRLIHIESQCRRCARPRQRRCDRRRGGVPRC